MRIREVFTAGQTKPYSIYGNYFRLASLTGVTRGSISVIFWRRGVQLNLDVAGIDAGQGVADDGGFDHIDLTSAEAQTVEFQVLRGRTIDNRVTGDVSIIDGGKARTLAGQAYIGVGGIQAAGGQFPHVQFKNPAASGMRSILKSIMPGLSGAAQAQLWFHDADLAVAGGAVRSKLAGGADGVTLIKTESNAAPLGTTQFGTVYLGAAVSLPLPLQEPIVLQEGKGVLVRAQTVALILVATAEVVEEPK
jgi:hypothetical protein